MKLLLKILLLLSLSLIVIGYNIESLINGRKFIGLGVLLFAFILMPLFIFYRYKNRIGEFIDKRMEKPNDQNN